MLKKIKTLLPAALLTITFLAAGQDVEPFNPYGDIMPSVNTYSMIKYGNFTPSLYTGAMSYSVPIYTYKDPDFEIPISLDYNYDGFRPSTYSGEVGLGWMLNVGGVITREVRGVPDEQSEGLYGYFYTVQDSILFDHRYTLQDSRYFKRDFNLAEVLGQINIAESQGEGSDKTWYDVMSELLDPFSDRPVLGFSTQDSYETTPDIFHFNMFGMTGDFSRFPDGTVKVYNSNIPHGDLKVDISFDKFGIAYGYNHRGMCITITTSDGTQYIFGGSDSAIEYNESVTSMDYNQPDLDSDYGVTISSLKLAKIIAPNKREAVFSYSAERQISVSSTSGRCNGNIKDMGFSLELRGEYNEYFQRQCYSVLESINIDGNNVVSFDYRNKEAYECDMEYFKGSYNNLMFNAAFSTIPKSLSKIRIMNKSGEQFEYANLSQSMSSNGTPKMFLDSLSVLGSGQHIFSYYDRDFFPKIDTDSTDHWDFWNNIPKHRPTVESDRLYSQRCAVFTPNFERTRAGALKTITFPTSGWSEIEYEPNEAYWLIDYSRLRAPYLISNTENFMIGGLRVNRIINHIGAETECVNYTYNDPDNLGRSSGILSQMPRYLVAERMGYYFPGGYFVGDILHHTPAYTFNFIYYSSTFCSHFNIPRNNFITYKSVQRHFDDGSREETDFHSYIDSPNLYGISLSLRNNYSFREKHFFDLELRDHYVYDTELFGEDRLPVYGLTDPSFCDKACIRGKKKEERVYAADNSLMKKNTYDYDLNLIASTDTMWFNNVINFIGVRYDCYNADLRSTTTAVRYPEANNEIVTMEGMDYNGSGQISNKSNTYETASEKIYYQYTHETGQTSPSGLDRLLCDAVKTRLEDGHELLVAAEHYDYGISGNPHPTAITTYVIDSPIQVDPITLFSSLQSSLNGCRTKVSTFTYDSHQRLTHASFPGGAQTDYTWTSDGRYVESKIVNIEGNTTIFEWRDLVGLTKVQDPSGRSESYLYDSRNRLMKRLDSETNTTEEYHYHLENE